MIRKPYDDYRLKHSCSGLCKALGTCEIETTPQSIESTFTGRHESFQYTKVRFVQLCVSSCDLMSHKYSQGLAEFPKFERDLSPHSQLPSDLHVLFRSPKGGSSTQEITVIQQTPTCSISARPGKIPSRPELLRALIVLQL